jgi:hypothetical protein
VEEQKRSLFVDTLRATVSQKNGSTMPGKRHMVSAAEFGMKTERNWDLQVWELTGEPSSWRAQLDAFYKAQPVFAVLSGISNSTWAPVHAFCEEQKVPCWFPSVDVVPENADKGLYSLYFSRGVTLEAEVLAAYWKRLEKADRPRRVVQVEAGDEAGTVASAALRKALHGTIAVETRHLDAINPEALSNALKGLGAHDALVMWLHADDLMALDHVEVPRASVYFSGSLADGERSPLAAEWKLAAHLIYPYELPQRRGANLAYFRTWINQRQIPLLDEPMQSEVYFSAVYFSDTVTEMFNNLYRDYLIERAENMLSKREHRKAEEETHERQTIRSRYVQWIQAGRLPDGQMAEQTAKGRAVVTPEDNLGKRTGTTAYPALGLGPGQRFASKGAYIVKFTKPTDVALTAESQWIVP